MGAALLEVDEISQVTGVHDGKRTGRRRRAAK
jgi:hypothetical protein